jgi:hypothetical protein
MTSSRQSLRVLVVIAAALGLAACGGDKRKVPAVPATSVRVGTLALTLPRGFSRRNIRRDRRLIGVLVTDYRVKVHSPTLTRGVFPANGVALVLGQISRSQVGVPALRLPLSLNELRGPEHHANGTAWNGVLRLDGSLYAISFWAGRTAGMDDRAALLRTLASIRRAR